MDTQYWEKKNINRNEFSSFKIPIYFFIYLRYFFDPGDLSGFPKVTFYVRGVEIYHGLVK